MMYSALVEEYKTIRGKLSQLSGDEHKAAMIRLIEIDKALKEMDRNIPRWSGCSTNYKNELSIIGMAVEAAVTKKIIDNSLYSKQEYKAGIRDAFFIGCIVGCTVITLAFVIAAIHNL